MWVDKLQNDYDNDFEKWKAYSDMYGLAERLGFESPEEAWEANPLVQGSVYPEDFKVVTINEIAHRIINNILLSVEQADQVCRDLERLDTNRTILYTGVWDLPVWVAELLENSDLMIIQLMGWKAVAKAYQSRC